MQTQTREEEIAKLAMLTGDEQLARFGKVLLDDESRKRILAQRQAEFEHRKGQPTHMGQGFMYDPQTKSASQDPNYAAFTDKQHQQGLEKYDARERAAIEREERKRNKITSTERKTLADLDSKLQLGRDALDGLAANPEAVEPFADTATNVVKGVWPDMGNLIESAHKSDDELDALNKTRRFIAGIRKSELGSALTGYELTKGAEWDPTAGGIAPDESQRRLNNLLQYLNQEYEVLRAGRPLQSSSVQPQNAAPQAAPPQAEQEWVIGKDGVPKRVR